MKTLSIIALALSFSAHANAQFTTTDAPQKVVGETTVCADKTVTFVKSRTEIELTLKEFNAKGKLISGTSKDSCRLEMDFQRMVPSKSVVVCDIDSDAGVITIEMKTNNMGVTSLVDVTSGIRHNCE